MMSGNRILFLFLAVFLWKNANGLGVFLNRPANYYQKGGGSKSLGDQALYPVQQDFSSTASGLKTAVYDVGSVQPLGTSGTGDSVANVPGFLWQYTVSNDQNVLNQYSPAPQSQGDYTAQSSGTSGGLSLLTQSITNQAGPGFQSQLVSSPVSSGQGISSLPQSFTANYVFGTQTQPSTPGKGSVSVASDFPTTSQQASSGSQSAAATLYGQPSSWYSYKQGQTPSQSVTTPYKPVSQTQTLTSQSPASQQSSLSSSSLGSASVFGIQAQSSSPVTSTLSVASDFPATFQQASSGSHLAADALYGQPSSWYSSTPGQSFQTASPFGASPYKSASPSQGSVGLYTSTLQTPSQFQPSPFKPVSPSQGSASQSLVSQPLSLSDSYVFGTQPSTPGKGSVSVASDFPTTSQQASSGSQLAAGTVYGQPSSWYSFTKGQTPSQSVTASYKPGSTIQDLVSQSPASQQSVLSSPNLGSASVIGVQAQSSSPVTSTLSVASDFPATSQQASYGFQSATGTLYGQASSVYSSTQGQSVKVPSQSADVPNTPAITVMGVYTAGPARWYRINPFGHSSQTSSPLSPSQASGSQGSQAASSSFPTPSQTQSTTGTVGFGSQSQTAPASTVSLTQSYPASTVSLTQSAAQLPSFQIPSGFSSTSFSASSPSVSLYQPILGGQSPLGSGVSTSFGQSFSGPVPPVATTQQYSSDALPSTGFSGTFPSQVTSTSQASGNYGSTFQSSTTQVGSFDQYSPLSVASTSAQGTPTSFGLLQGHSSQPYGFNPVFQPPPQRGHDFSVKN